MNCFNKVNPGCFKLAFLILLVFLILLIAQDNKITIIGTVEGLEFDEDDNVLEVMIVVPQDTGEFIEYVNYVVLRKGKGLKLLELVDETVEVTGNLEIDSDGNNTIEVLKFQVISPPELEEDMPEFDEDIEQ